MELVLFICLILLGLLVLILESNKLLNFVYLPLTILFMFIVRMHYDADIKNYAIYMSYTSNAIYYVKEFIFWYGQRFLFHILHNPFFVFLLMDWLWIFIIFRTAKKIDRYQRFKGGLFVVLMTSFPFFLGYENIYRQFYATIILLYAYSIVNSNFKKSMGFFLIAIFIHNTALLTLPFFLMKRSKYSKIYRKIAFLITLLFISLLHYMSQFKSGHPTGIDTSKLYLLMFLIFFYVYLIKFKFYLNRIFIKLPSLFIIILYMSALEFMPYDMIPERLGMMFLTFLLTDLWDYSNNINFVYKRVFLRVLLLITFSLPVFIFHNAYIMLQ